MATSKKWVYGTGGFPKCLRQTTFTPPTPSTLKPTEIQIANKAFAINPVDVQAMNMYNTATSYLPWPLSALTGGGGQQEQEGGREVCCDFAGTVTHAGAQSGYQVGDEVFGFTMRFVDETQELSPFTPDERLGATAGLAISLMHGTIASETTSAPPLKSSL